MSVTTDRIQLSASNRVTPLTMTSLHNRVGLALALAVAVLGVALAVGALSAALQWRSEPFFGALLTRTLVVDGSVPVSTDTWPALEAGLQRGDQIIALNGQALSDTPDNYETALQNFLASMQALNVGDTVQVAFLRPAEFDSATTATLCDTSSGGELLTCSVRYTLSTFPANDFLAFFVVPFVCGLIALIVGIGVLALRPKLASTRSVAAIACMVAVFMIGLFDLNTTYRFIGVWIFSTATLGGTLVALSMVFPSPLAAIYRQPALRFVPIVVAGLIGIGLILLHLNPSSPRAFSATLIATAVAALGMTFLAISMWVRRSLTTSGIARDQINTVLIGSGLSLIIVVIWMVNTIFITTTGMRLLPINTSAATPFFLLPVLSMAYAVLQYRMVDTDRLFSRAITYTVMLFGLAIGYFLLVFSISFLTQDVLQANNPLVLALVIFVIAVLFVPVRTRLQDRIDRIYFRRRHDFQGKIEAFAQKLGSLSDFGMILKEYRTQIETTLQPGQVFIFLPNRQTGEYVAYVESPKGGAPRPATDVRFAPDSALVKWFQKSSEHIYLEPGKPWPPELLAERARLMILQAALILELRGASRVNGFIIISPPRSSAGRYTFEEVRFIQNLTNQISVAVERAQVVESLERRVRELDVLSQVSQAANFTIDFDSLLELISAQATRLIDASHFYIVLYDATTNELYFAFCLEQGERYEDRENKRWPIGRDLFSEVVRSGQFLRVANFAQAMGERGSTAELVSAKVDPNLKAWMGVPLMAGARALGALAAGTSQSGRVYNDDQLKIFQDIGALAATSLDKSRLFAETNARARQLAALNDISSKLVAVEFDVEKLLQLITASATDILDAAAGSLLLTVDDGTEDLEFRVVVGSSGQELIGTRIPARRGLVGEVAATGQLVIVNDVATDPRWGGELSKSNFQTNNILAVPLLTQNRVIGVLEVLNKKGGASFSPIDAQLLTTFAGQAAVAIENARLFQLTDQQLSARLTELETLERIDFELNRSLDLGKVAEITVRYALSASGAVAGVLGIVNAETPHLEIVFKCGYGEDEFPEGAEGSIWPLDRGIVKRVMRTRQADLVPDVRIDPDYVPSLRGGLSQIVVPMMSGNVINALLVLETNKEPRLRLADMPFLQRLAEHASIAIANAQLVTELERANQSKSEFVSFVAHELKNPLTSMRGFADLLISGAPGALNDFQKDFITRIRSGAERMTTLVSDLNDVTQLETNKMSIKLVPTDFREVIDETLRPFEKQLADKRQTLQLNIPDDLPKVMADRDRMIQVLINLVSNAHKYTPEDGQIMIDCAVETHRRDSKGRQMPPVVHVSVRDTGIGMSPEDLKKLFTPYFRSDNPLTRLQPGTGLGLTLTRNLIVRHNGEIWVESELNVGTTFHFTLPVAPAEEGEPSGD
jgi:signal transduction histidine kinase